MKSREPKENQQTNSTSKSNSVEDSIITIRRKYDQNEKILFQAIRAQMENIKVEGQKPNTFSTKNNDISIIQSKTDFAQQTLPTVADSLRPSQLQSPTIVKQRANNLQLKVVGAGYLNKSQLKTSRWGQISEKTTSIHLEPNDPVSRLPFISVSAKNSAENSLKNSQVIFKDITSTRRASQHTNISINDISKALSINDSLFKILKQKSYRSLQIKQAAAAFQSTKLLMVSKIQNAHFANEAQLATKYLKRQKPLNDLKLELELQQVNESKIREKSSSLKSLGLRSPLRINLCQLQQQK